MKRVTDYRENARECRQLAARMPPEQRSQLLAMAATWEQIADERQAAVSEGRDYLPLHTESKSRSGGPRGAGAPEP